MTSVHLDFSSVQGEESLFIVLPFALLFADQASNSVQRSEMISFCKVPLQKVKIITLVVAPDDETSSIEWWFTYIYTEEHSDIYRSAPGSSKPN